MLNHKNKLMNTVLIKITLAILVMSLLVILNPVNAATTDTLNYDQITIDKNAIEIDPGESMKEMAESLDMEVRSFKTTTELPEVKTFTRNAGMFSSENTSTYSEKIISYLTPKSIVESSLARNTSIVFSSAYLESEIFFQEKVVDNIDYVKLISADGSISKFNSGFYLVKQDIAVGCSGAYDGNPLGTQSDDFSVTNKVWSYTAPSAWVFVSKRATHFVGATVTATIQHGTSIYEGKLQNNI